MNNYMPTNRTKKKINFPKRYGQISQTYSLPKLSQEDTGNLNRPITRCEIESIIKKKFPANKSPRLNNFTGKLYQTYEELIPTLF